MYIPDDMQKVNKFVDVAIPSNRSYFSRIGEVTAPSTQFTGDELARMNQDKIAQISEAMQDYEKYVESQNNKENESH